MKAEKVIWFSAIGTSIGIVMANNGTEKKVYINSVIGIDEENDIKDILERGAKITLDQAESIVKHLKEN